MGYIPPEALSWNDADDNNGFHEKLFVMDFDGTLSTELAMISNKEVLRCGGDAGDAESQRRLDDSCQVGVGGGFIPKGAKGVEVAKDLMKFWMQPQQMNDNLKAGLGRWVPAIPQVVKDDPWWTEIRRPAPRAVCAEVVFWIRPPSTGWASHRRGARLRRSSFTRER